MNQDTLITRLAELAISNQRVLAAAESCTGGLIAAACTELSGSSVWFDRGFVTYSNASKRQMLEVPQEILDQQGAVSEAAVKAMANGAVEHSDANLSVAVSGVAGPTGGSVDKPVGTVWIACSGDGMTSFAEHFVFVGDRRAVRKQTVEHALQSLIKCIESDSL